MTAVKLGDFGLAIRLEENELINQKCGSPVYVAPEGKDFKQLNRVHDNIINVLHFYETI